MGVRRYISFINCSYGDNSPRSDCFIPRRIILMTIANALTADLESLTCRRRRQSPPIETSVVTSSHRLLPRDCGQSPHSRHSGGVSMSSSVVLATSSLTASVRTGMQVLTDSDLIRLAGASPVLASRARGQHGETRVKKRLLTWSAVADGDLSRR